MGTVLQSMGLQRVRHDLVTKQYTTKIRIKDEWLYFVSHLFIKKHSSWNTNPCVSIKFKPLNLFYCCCSVAKPCQSVCNSIDCRTPDYSVLHYLLESVKVLVPQSCLVLAIPRKSLTVSSVCGILLTRILEWITIPFSRESSQASDWTQVPYITDRFFTVWATRKAHCLSEFAQIHVHWVSDDIILTSHLLLLLSSLAFIFPSSLFQWVDSLYQVAKVLELQL